MVLVLVVSRAAAVRTDCRRVSWWTAWLACLVVSSVSGRSGCCLCVVLRCRFRRGFSVATQSSRESSVSRRSKLPCKKMRARCVIEAARVRPLGSLGVRSIAGISWIIFQPAGSLRRIMWAVTAWARRQCVLAVLGIFMLGTLRPMLKRSRGSSGSCFVKFWIAAII